MNKQLNLNLNNNNNLNLKIENVFKKIDELILDLEQDLSKDDLYSFFIFEIEQLIENDYLLIKDEQEFIQMEDLSLFADQAEVDEIINGASLVKIKRRHLNNLKEMVFAEYN